MIATLRTTVGAVAEAVLPLGGLPSLAAPEDLVVAGARRGAHAERTLAGRVALRLLLAHVLGAPAAEAPLLPIERTCDVCGEPHGRPRTAGAALSGSASGPHVLVAVAACEDGAEEPPPLGVDIQELPRTLWDGFDAAVLHPDEHLTESAGPRARVDLWTRKEAVLKAAGVGLRIDPHRLRLVPRLTRGVRQWAVHECSPRPTLGLVVEDLPGEVPCALATSADSRRPMRAHDLGPLLPAPR
ncbi:4'-phosphopantetheinyl transferase family protein [Brachybacterium sp. NPDC056505]|uniref:4'-phosphopantetheinyl transferase family protein n=1 Tax=Brachybacterium sp. NPDC056505 TaxID=3345843 RepID=UPI00366D0973